MDALAGRGARFDSAYCNSPLCAPSRFSFMSGQLVTRIGAYDNACEFPASVPTFAHYLRSMGYRTCLSGKMHFVGPDQMHGFEERITTDVYASDYAWTPDWEKAETRIDKWYHNMDSVLEAGVAAATFQLDYDDEVAFFARRRIFDYAREQSGPFCLVASFIHPHDPYVARQAWWDLYDSSQIDLPATNVNDAPEDPFSRRLREGILASEADVSDQQLRRARQAYYANTSYFDDKVGQLVQALTEAELLENTIVIVTSDHSDMLGERGLWYKMNFFEHSVRVPLIMAGPGVVQTAVPNSCSLLDLLPTLIDLAAMDGRNKPELGQPVDGQTLLPLAQGLPDDYDQAIAEYCAEMTASPVMMIRRGRYKYIYCQTDPAQLYDLAADPQECSNLAGLPDYASVEQLFLEEVGDRWNIPDIQAAVIQSQHQRRAIFESMGQGTPTHWDYNPPRNASQEYVRNHEDWTVAAEQTRFPRYSGK